MKTQGSLRQPASDKLRLLADTALAEASLRAERLGWISSAAEWMECQQLRNFMIHEYVRDMEVLAAALSRGHAAVPLLESAASALAGLIGPVDSGAARSSTT